MPRKNGQMTSAEARQLNLRRRCAVCRQQDVPTDYMVWDDLWAEAGFRPDQIAHLGCFAQRMGRFLRSEDFTPYPINDTIAPMFPSAKDVR